MRTTLRSLLLVASTVLFFTSFADARNGNQAGSSGSRSGSNGSVQEQTSPGICPAATPSQDGTGKQVLARGGNRDSESANGGQKGKGKGKGSGNGNGNANGNGNGNANGNGNGSGKGKTDQSGGSTTVDPVEG